MNWGAATAMTIFQEDPGNTLEDIVDVLALADFPTREILMGASEYSIDAFGAPAESEHREAILARMRLVGCPQKEIDAALPDLEHALEYLRHNVFGCEL